VPLGAAGRCRLCLATTRATGTIPTPHRGIQLFALAHTPTRVPGRTAEPIPPPGPAAAGLGQLRLHSAPRGPRGPGRRPRQHSRPRLVSHQQRRTGLPAALDSYGQARGWPPDALRRAQRSLAVLLASQPTLTEAAPLDAAAVHQFLRDRHQGALRLVEFLTDQGLLTSDPHATLDAWLARRLQELPDQVRAETQTWVEALRGHGPRAARPHKTATIQGYLRALEPALADWSARYQSLRQVTRDDITAQLQPLTGPTRKATLAVMRSLFRALKAQRLVFTNPTAGLQLPRLPPPPALGLDPARRAGLLAQLQRPDQRLIVLLTGIHALQPHQIRLLTLHDVDLGAGTLLVGGRSRRLDALTLEVLHAWLQARHVRWPQSANPYLLVSQHTANGRSPVTRGFLQQVFQRLGLTASQMRIDRLLAEVHHSDGDPLTLTRLFGLSDTTAIRYCLELGPLD
jgi:site-specific recombinase XerD